MADSSVVEFDWLVLALGSDTVTFGIPGVKELALPFTTFDDAMRVGGVWGKVWGANRFMWWLASAYRDVFLGLGFYGHRV